MKVYISGVVHGSHADGSIFDQSYREQIRNALQERYSDVSIVSPVSEREHDRGRDVLEGRFFGQIQQALTANVIVAYLPEASMGAAIEMWEGYKNSRPLIVISPLENWSVKFLASRVYPDLNAFISAIGGGDLDELLLDRYANRDNYSRK